MTTNSDREDEEVRDRWTTRTYLIAQLDGHFGRYLRNDIIREVADARRHLEQMGDDGTLTRGMAVKTYVKWLERWEEKAIEAAQALEAARQCPDECLDDLVRWQTNENWRTAMQRAGMKFDMRTLRWIEVDEV